ncbi:MAG: hypothetical protein IPQ07_02800 [Myxococcales bacterium]|nr:hypothetical protein [Myxococcales bacterium]
MSSDIERAPGSTSSDIERVLWELDEESSEPRVLVDPTLEAFCLVTTRTARGTTPPPQRRSERLPLHLIQAYLRENAADDDAGENEGESPDENAG